MHREARQGHGHEDCHSVVAETKDSNIEGINEFNDALIEEPVSNGRVLLDSFATSQDLDR